MRTNIVLAAAVAFAAFPLFATVARSADFGHAAPTGQHAIVQVAQQCGPGEYWEEAGYVAGGKWRDAHCAKVSGRQ